MDDSIDVFLGECAICSLTVVGSSPRRQNNNYFFLNFIIILGEINKLYDFLTLSVGYLHAVLLQFFSSVLFFGKILIYPSFWFGYVII